MHARELVELAGLAAQHGQQLIDHHQPIDPAALERYWAASKCRFDRWGRALKNLRDAGGSPREYSRAEHRLRDAVLEEVLTGEILVRVWTAVLVGRELAHSDNEAGVVARSVLFGQQEAGNRALDLLVNSPAIEAEAAVRLNRLRRRSERWTDLLVGMLAVRADVCCFAPDPDRAADFASDLRSDGPQARRLLLSSLRAAFATGLGLTSPNADLNAEIAAAVVGSFDGQLFDASGLLRTQWMTRLYNAPRDTQVLLAELFDEPHLALQRSDPPAPHDPVMALRRNRLRQ